MDSYDYGTGALAGISVGFIIFLLLVPFLIWLITLISIIKSPNWTPGMKALWALAALPSGFIGMICWFVWGTKEGNKLQQTQSFQYQPQHQYPTANPYQQSETYTTPPTAMGTEQYPATPSTPGSYPVPPVGDQYPPTPPAEQYPPRQEQ